MNSYAPRIVDQELDALFPALSAIALEGAKAVGKTATAERRARTVHRLDAPAMQLVARADPAVLLRDPPPILLDEWQHTPAIWDAVRRAVDRDPTPGRFLLAGSATPRTLPTHSGAGRIVRMRMRPLSLVERGHCAPTVSLAELQARAQAPITGSHGMGLMDYLQEIVRSGFPAIRRLPDRPLRLQLDGYLERVIDRDFEEQGHAIRHPAMLRRWMTAFAAATSTTTTWEKLRHAAASGEEDVPAKTTVLAYREVLERLWILDDLPGWIPTRNHLARLTQSPKHHLVDPALAARLLGADQDAMLRDGTLLGRLFESLVTQSVRVYAQATESRVGHLRTHRGEHEVDLIVEARDHSVVAIEVKAAADITDADVQQLLWLKDQLGDDVRDLVVITTGTHAYRRRDGVAVVPACLLGP